MLVETFTALDIPAHCFAANHAGADVRVGEETWSLKTQGDKNLKPEFLTIHKFMEAGRGNIDTHSDRIRLIYMFRQHASQYERLFVLRCYGATTDSGGIPAYELVEVPLSLFTECPSGPVRLSETSDRQPQPFLLNVPQQGTDSRAYQFYFNGGSERKVRINYLEAALCTTHLRWHFST